MFGRPWVSRGDAAVPPTWRRGGEEGGGRGPQPSRRLQSKCSSWMQFTGNPSDSAMGVFEPVFMSDITWEDITHHHMFIT